MTTRIQSTMVLWLLLALVGCVPPEPTSTAPEPEPESTATILERDLMPELIATTEAARQLELRHPFDTETMSRDEIHEFIAGKLEEADLDSAQTIMRAFGFIPDDTDLTALMLDILSAEVVGLYDPEQDRMIVLESVVDGLFEHDQTAMMGRMVLVHEITHAIQDQHFTTLVETGDEAWSDDGRSVFGYLAEGGATLTMMVATVRGAGAPIDPTRAPNFRQRLRASEQSAMPASAELQQAPPYLSYTLTATYFEGAAFMAELRLLGGWPAVNAAHRRPPRSTRDILHTEAYLTARPFFEVELPEALPGLEAPTYRRVARARLGELETSAYLLPLQDREGARLAAEGWAGDTFAVYARADGGVALVWRLHFESAEEAQEFYLLARRSHIASGRGPCEAVDTPRPPELGEGLATRCQGGGDWLERRGSDVVVLRSVPLASASAIAQALLSAPLRELRATPPQPQVLQRLRDRQDTENEATNEDG